MVAEAVYGGGLQGEKTSKFFCVFYVIGGWVRSNCVILHIFFNPSLIEELFAEPTSLNKPKIAPKGHFWEFFSHLFLIQIIYISWLTQFPTTPHR